MDSSPNNRDHQLPSQSIEQQPELSRKPSLLPAFEPLSSSPFPRPQSSKRKFEEDSPTFPKQQLKYYPTPVPTSSTGILPSSPPRNARPALQRTVSALSERTPLGAVPTVDLPADGEIVRMGRSSNSADYQLSTNRLISRVHVQAAYHAPTASYAHGYIEIECLGWNGAKVHCRGRVFDLNKGDTYMSENPEAEIMLDVQDTRVMIAWPAVSARKLSWDSDEDVSPVRRPLQDAFTSSPPMFPRSPVSQSPIRQPVFSTTLGVNPQPGTVQVFEDADSREDDGSSTPTPADETFIRPTKSSPGPIRENLVRDPKSSIRSSFGDDDFSDGDEENDPIVHSFGPFGENILNGLASFSTATPTQPSISGQRRRAALTSPSPKRRSSSESVRFKDSPIKNHVINQLAFSRVHSQPLSVIHGNLPAELKVCLIKNTEDKIPSGSEASTPVPRLSQQDLKRILDETPCIGEIPRSGKDAAGKALENEFYYVPEMDSNQMRRESIISGMRGTGLRSVRKSHKQYYWKRPRV